MSELKAVNTGVQVSSGSDTFVVQDAAEVPTPATGKSIKTFQFGSPGDRAISAGDGFSSGGEESFLSADRSWSGSQSARCSTRKGESNSNYFGGYLQIPNNVYKGQEIWFQIHAYFDSDFKWGGVSQDTTKFMRLTTDNGHIDIYARKAGSATAWSFVSEVTNPAQQSVKFGIDGVDSPTLGGWGTYEFYVKLDKIPADEGGEGMARFWKDGKLLGEFTNLRTLANTDDFIKNAILFTFWNGANGVDVPPKQGCWIDDIIIQTSQPTDTDAAGNKMIGNKG